jgi:hypothetical protein
VKLLGIALATVVICALLIAPARAAKRLVVDLVDQPSAPVAITSCRAVEGYNDARTLLVLLESVGLNDRTGDSAKSNPVQDVDIRFDFYDSSGALLGYKTATRNINQRDVPEDRFGWSSTNPRMDEVDRQRCTVTRVSFLNGSVWTAPIALSVPSGTGSQKTKITRTFTTSWSVQLHIPIRRR